MKSTFSGSSSAFTISVKLITATAIFCMVFNGLAPRYSITPHDYDELSRVVGTQILLMQFFSFSTIPMTIVNQLMRDVAGKPHANHHTKKQSGTSTEASAGFSIVSGETRQIFNRGAASFPDAPSHLSPVCMFQQGYLNRSTQGPPVDPPIGFIVNLLLFFFLLPRSGIEDHATIAAIKNFYARFAHATRVFCCFGERAAML
ncbi:MAG: hypothetical protein ABSH12_05435 [Endomicrobiales bacterium]|jgi:hypothetical protein